MSQADFSHYIECSLDLAVDLANTHDPRTEANDELGDLRALTEFVKAHGVSSPPRVTAADLPEVRRVAARLRGVFEAGEGKRAARALNEILADTGAHPILTDHDGEPWHLHYAAPDAPLAERLAAESAMALAVVIAQDGFERLRICEAERCEDVFVDRSRNRSRRYCSPEVCGNRASVAAWRARRRATDSA